MNKKIKKYENTKLLLNPFEIKYLYRKNKLLISSQQGNNIQRTYNEWDKERSKDYINSVENNFLHNPIYIMDFQNKWYVVDGQHRLMSIISYVDEGEKKYNDISLMTFEFIIIKINDLKKGNYIKEGAEIFRILNDTQSDVKNGAIYKTLLYTIDENESIELFDKYNETFKTFKTKKGDLINQDRVFDMLGLWTFFITQGYSLNDDENIGKKIKDYFKNMTNKKTIIDSIKKLKIILDKMSENEFYGNKNNSKNVVPTKNILIPFSKVFLSLKNDEKNKNLISQTLEKFNNVLSSDKWKNSKKNTRTPSALNISAKIISDIWKNKDINEGKLNELLT